MIAETAEVEQHLGPHRPRRRGRRGLLKQFLGALHLRGLERVPTRVGGPANARPSALGRRQPSSELGQLRGRLGGTARPGPYRGILQQLRDALIGSLGRQGQVPSPFFLVGGAVGQDPVRPPAFLGR